ncbi:MAG: DUF3783 domain-containing protein [Ruminococcus sp.]|nr:DUF3783 domain-containing protein [Ruminococcus sp.]
MKARIAAPAKLIAAYGLSPERLQALSLFCDREGIKLRSIGPAEADCTVGYLCGSSTTPGAECTDAPAGECLIFAGFDRPELSEAVSGLRQAGLSVPLKAVCTPHNQDWTLRSLMAELAREHARMTGNGGSK